MDLLKKLNAINEGVKLEEARHHVNPIEFGLRNKDNIAKAIENLLSSGINCEFDTPKNYKSMGIFYFTFKSESDLKKAIKRITNGANQIDTSVEEEWQVKES